MMVPEHLLRTTWECVHFTRPERWSTVVGLIEVDRHFVRTIDAGNVDNKEELLDSLADAMEFPGYFGRNWDALSECLRDLSWQPQPQYIIAITNARHLWTTCYEVAGTLVEVWQAAAESWGRTGTPFHLVFIW